jgi:cob(I)alamin adenosyltransferase
MKKYRLEEGYVHLITGDGPGKTTSAIGLAIRAMGNGLKVCMVQFMKSSKTVKEYGELTFLNKSKNIIIKQFGTGLFLDKEKYSSQDRCMAEKGLNFAKEIMFSGKVDLLILDEVNVALDFGLLNTRDILTFIKSKPKNVELILTGRNAPKKLYKKADYVIFIRSIKHPFNQGIKARKGIEY